MPASWTQAAPPRHRSPVRYIAGGLLALIVVVGLFVLITWLAVRPRKLRYSIEQGSISNFNLTTNDRLNANLHFVLRAENPNRRISLYYDRIDVTVWYEDQKISINNVQPFYQRRRNVTHVDLYLMAKDATVYGAAARDLRMERASGDLQVDVAIKAKIRLKVGVLKIHRKLKVRCQSVPAVFSPSKAYKTVFCDADID